nr:hypothetical protein Iba_chr06eCG0590 [Ipomoea batatas]
MMPSEIVVGVLDGCCRDEVISQFGSPIVVRWIVVTEVAKKVPRREFEERVSSMAFFCVAAFHSWGISCRYGGVNWFVVIRRQSSACYGSAGQGGCRVDVSPVAGIAEGGPAGNWEF